MAKKTTARQRDIARLAEQYQSQLGSLTSEYEDIYQKKQSALQAGGTQTGEYAKRLEEFNKQLAAYKENPMTMLGYMKPVKKSTDYYFTEDGKTKYLSKINEGDYSFEGLAVYRKNKMPTFTEEAPVSADISQYDAESAALEEKKKSLGEGFQREVAERKAGRMSAVGRRAQSRPMLSKGVTL
jgi:DNA repair exonuclease SbcCD ATPase subunit